jgi:hypothetical protein
MGIDIYMRWDGMTEEDRDKQITGFEDGAGDVHIPAKELRKRLPLTKDIVIQRAKEVYKEELTEDDEIVKSFENFVKLSEALEEQGRKPTIYASW